MAQWIKHKYMKPYINIHLKCTIGFDQINGLSVIKLDMMIVSVLTRLYIYRCKYEYNIPSIETCSRGSKQTTFFYLNQFTQITLEELLTKPQMHHWIKAEKFKDTQNPNNVCQP